MLRSGPEGLTRTIEMRRGHLQGHLLTSLVPNGCARAPLVTRDEGEAVPRAGVGEVGIVGIHHVDGPAVVVVVELLTALRTWISTPSEEEARTVEGFALDRDARASVAEWFYTQDGPAQMASRPRRLKTRTS